MTQSYLTKREVSKDDCWLWAGHTNSAGYGRLTVHNQQFLAHRYMYTLEVGEIPEGLTLDHLCNVPTCINPDHMEPVTLRVNLLRGRTGRNLLKTHCPSGHPYSPENTYYLRGKWRRCRTCVRTATRAWAAKKRDYQAKDECCAEGLINTKVIGE